MKFSVIIPAYNSELFLAQTLDCLLAQTLKDLQIIVVNDGSSDSTADIIAEYAQKSSSIVSVYQQNSGVSAARNNGLGYADGEYTLFLDSDDLLSPDSLEKIYNKLRNTGADMAIWRILRFGYGGDEFNPVADSLAKEDLIDCFDNRLLWNFLLGNKCFRTSMIKSSEVRFPPLRYSEDGAFIMQLIYDKKPKITGVSDAVYHYRRHTPKEGFSVSQSISAELVEHFSQSLGIVYNAAEKATDSEDYLQEILYKTYSSLINEFYRILWRADNDTVKLIGKKCDEIKAKMNAATLKKCEGAQKDIGNPIFDKKEIAQKPFVSVIAKKCTAEFVESLYAQSMPLFELITSDKANLPECENITVADAKSAKGRIKIVCNGKTPLDSRYLKVISLLKRSPKFGFLPDFIINLGARLFLKIKK